MVFYLEHGDWREQSAEGGLWAGLLEGFSFSADSWGSFHVAAVGALFSLGLCLGQAQLRRPQGSAGSAIAPFTVLWLVL